MSWDELRERGHQEVAKRVDVFRYRIGASFGNRGNLGQTAPCQKARFFFSGEEAQAIVGMMRQRLPEEMEQIVATAHKVCRHEFDLLGFRSLDFGDSVDWHFDPVHQKRAPLRPWYRVPFLNPDEVGDVKIIWELNRHQHLVTLAKAYLLAHDAQFCQELIRQWREWQKQNPYPLGINWASSLEVGFRSLSWLWVRHLLADRDILPESFRSELLQALALNGRHIETYLSTYSSPNTHLLGEGVALFFLGVLCPEIPAARRWKHHGWRIVCQEAQRQVFSDGMHIEQSIYYHVYALDFFLHARILAARNEIPIPADLDKVLEKMLDFLLHISQAGIVPRLGDDDGGRIFDPHRNRAEHLLDPLGTGAVLFHRADWARGAAANPREETMWLLGARAASELDGLVRDEPLARTLGFHESGVYVMASHHTLDQQLVIDAGRQGAGTAGHGHADALSVHVSAAGREWLADPGTFSYSEGTETRDAFRTTMAHNTLQVDGMSQAQATGPFSWANLPEVRVDNWTDGDRFAFFEGHHMGYRRLAKPVIHRRSIFYLKSRFWIIRDVAEGEGEHRLDLHWHLAPGIDLNRRRGNAFAFGTNDDMGLALVVAEGHDWSTEFLPGWHSPVYGQKESTSILRFSKSAVLPAGFTSLLLAPQDGNGELNGRMIVTEGSPRSTLHSCAYLEGRKTHRWVLSTGNARWQLGTLASDARMLYCSFDDCNRLTHFVLCDGSFFKMATRTLFQSDERVSSHEWQDNS
jgi:hypothetical protein